jgi:Surface antigen
MDTGHNCTNYAAYVLQTVNGASAVMGLGNAYQWAVNASAKGVTVNGTAGAGSIAQWNANAGGHGAMGHVAYVESVNNDGSITLSEDNWSAGPFRWKIVSSGSPYWPSNFIHFKDLPGSLGTNRPSGGGGASTRGDHRLDLFIQGTNPTGANTFHNWSDAAPWGGWQLLEATTLTRVTSAVASVSWSSDRIDLFARGEAGDLMHKWWNASTGWGDWVSMGSCIVDAPTVSSWGPARLDVFAQGCNSTGPNLLHWWWEGSAWGSETVPETGPFGRITSAPTATSWGLGRIDLFARGPDASLVHKWYNDWSGWGNWVTHGGTIIGAPTVSSWAAGRLDVFMVGTNPSGNNLWHNWYDGNGWWWEATPSNDNLFITNVLGAVSWGPGRIDILGRDSSGEPRHKFYDGGWSDWEHLGGGVAP